MIDQNASIGVLVHRKIIGQRAHTVDLDTYAEGLDDRTVALDYGLRRGLHHVNPDPAGRAQKIETIKV